LSTPHSYLLPPIYFFVNLFVDQIRNIYAKFIYLRHTYTTSVSLQISLIRQGESNLQPRRGGRGPRPLWPRRSSSAWRIGNGWRRRSGGRRRSSGQGPVSSSPESNVVSGSVVYDQMATVSQSLVGPCGRSPFMGLLRGMPCILLAARFRTCNCCFFCTIAQLHNCICTSSYLPPFISKILQKNDVECGHMV